MVQCPKCGIEVEIITHKTICPGCGARVMKSFTKLPEPVEGDRTPEEIGQEITPLKPNRDGNGLWF